MVTKRLEGRWTFEEALLRRSHFCNLLLLSVTLYAIFGFKDLILKNTLGNECFQLLFGEGGSFAGCRREVAPGLGWCGAGHTPCMEQLLC